MTEREAVAECVVTMTSEACAQLVEGTPKGNPLEAARIAGVMGVKRTPDLLPFCHPIAVTGAEVVVTPDAGEGRIRSARPCARSTAPASRWRRSRRRRSPRCRLYDTAKAFDRAARIDGLRLLSKRGGKSGDYVAERRRPLGRERALRVVRSNAAARSDAASSGWAMSRKLQRWYL